MCRFTQMIVISILYNKNKCVNYLQCFNYRDSARSHGRSVLPRRSQYRSSQMFRNRDLFMQVSCFRAVPASRSCSTTKVWFLYQPFLSKWRNANFMYQGTSSTNLIHNFSDCLLVYKVFTCLATKTVNIATATTEGTPAREMCEHRSNSNFVKSKRVGFQYFN